MPIRVFNNNHHKVIIMKIFVFLFLTSCASAGCGTDDLFCDFKKKYIDFYSYSGYYINEIDDVDLRGAVEETVADIERRSGERFMHVKKGGVKIKIKFGDLEPTKIGLATSWPKNCVIKMSSDFKKAGYYSKRDFVAVLRHEIGHCFGMGHDKDPSSVMYFQYDPFLQNQKESVDRFIYQLKKTRELYK